MQGKDEEVPELKASYSKDPTKKPRPKGRAMAPPSLGGHALGRRRSSGGESNDRFAPSTQDDPDSPENSSTLQRRASLHARSKSPNSIDYSPRTVRRSSGMKDGSGLTSPHHNVVSEAANVRVMVRVRPFGDKEIEAVEAEGGYIQSVIDMPRRDQVLILDHKRDYEVHQGFNFDEVFWSCTQQKSNIDQADQKHVYELTGMPALEAAWDGINSCIFAYGQTGSGKTHTMMGDPSQIANEEGCEEEQLGVIPRLCRDLFNELEKKEQSAVQRGLRRKSDVRVSFYEIYNEKVRDLLGRYCAGVDQERFQYAGTTSVKKLDPEDLKIREHPTNGPYVEGISVHNPKSYTDIIALINAGNQDRSVGSTNLNDRSSRSHAIFRITVTQTTLYDQQRVGIGGPKTTTHQRRANINLVDLAGSENVKRSGASGTVLIEAQKINLSLTTLRRVIDALIEKKSKAQVPYRDSTLTWLLREDLGGNAKTFMLATVSPHYLNAHESLRTLEYAMRARAIVNQIRINEDETAKMLADLEKKIFETAQQITKVQTEAERGELEQQMAEAKQASSEIQQRLEEAAAEALQYKEKLEAEKEKNMAFAFRHAVMLRAAKQRLQNAESKHTKEARELEDIKRKINEMGASNIDDLARTLTSEKDKVSDLVNVRMEMQKEKAALEKDHAELQERFEKDERTAKLEKQMNDEMNRDLARKDVQHKTQLNVMRQRLREENDAAVELHKQEMAKLEESHDKELRAILDENQTMAEEFQSQIQNLREEVARMTEEHAKTIKNMQQDQQQQQRYLHADIQRREEEIDKLDAELTLASRQRDELKQQLSSYNEQSARDKLEASVMSEKKLNDKIREIKKEHADVCEQLKDIALKADAEAVEKSNEKAEVQRFFASVGKKEEKYANSFELICHFLDQLPDGQVPASWTMDDIRKMVKAFQKFKRDYASFRPNKDTLKAMLRVNPTRMRADRIKELLENAERTEEEKEGEKVAVIMGGMRCPHVVQDPLAASVAKSDAADQEANGASSVAANVPYTTDLSPQNPEAAASTSNMSTSQGSPATMAASAPTLPRTSSNVQPASSKPAPKTARTRSRSTPRVEPAPFSTPDHAQAHKKRTPRTSTKVIKVLAGNDKLSSSVKRPSTGPVRAPSL